jgi:hypothetical protein
MRYGKLTCPWCPWESEVGAPTVDEAVEMGRIAIDQHNREAGHRVKPGTRARAGYFKGAPVP